MVILSWLQFWLQLRFASAPGGSRLPACGGASLSPQGLPHPVRGVLGEFGSDVGVALGLTELRVPEDLLHDADVDALLQQQRGRGVPGVMHPGLADAGLVKQCVPVIPVVMGVERSAGWRAED